MKTEIEDYLSYLSVSRRLSDATLKAYSRDLELYHSFIGREDILWMEADLRTARNFLSDLTRRGDSRASINRALSALRKFYDFYWKQDIIQINPFEGIRGLKKEVRLPQVIFSKEMDALFNSIPESGFAGTRDRFLFELLYSTGCRVSEAVGISLNDFSSDFSSLKVRGKGRKERFVFLGREARKSMIDFLPYRKTRLKVGDNGEHSALFINNRGGRLTVRGVTHILDKYIRKANLTGRISPHTFRHTFATDLLNNGANIREVQEMLGHSSLSTTQVYTHIGIEHAKRIYRKSHPHGGGKA